MPRTLTRRPDYQQRQPRIAGMRRDHASDCFLPVIKHGLDELGRTIGKTRSFVVADIVTLFFNLDAATGLPLPESKRASYLRMMIAALPEGERRKLLTWLVEELQSPHAGARLVRPRPGPELVRRTG